jgi:hypothetical protein
MQRIVSVILPISVHLDREGSALGVRFFKNSIHIQTWRALSTTQGNEIISGVD